MTRDPITAARMLSQGVIGNEPGENGKIVAAFIRERTAAIRHSFGYDDVPVDELEQLESLARALAGGLG